MSNKKMQIQVMTHVMCSAVTFYDFDSEGWFTNWRATAPNGQEMNTYRLGPYVTREEALDALDEYRG